MASLQEQAHCWIEIDEGALRGNLRVFKELAALQTKVMAVVKANAYGHGAAEVARVVVSAGADWLGVFSLEEGLALRSTGLTAPILVFGPVSGRRIEDAWRADLRLTVASRGMADAAVLCGAVKGLPRRVHLKLETGTNRQGLVPEEVLEVAGALRASGIEIEGAYTHFADIEDTTNHDFAQRQLARFEARLEDLFEAGFIIPMPHAACSAASILFPSTYFGMMRVGISLYGLWPSKETYVSARDLKRPALELRPLLTWKTRIAQIKTVESGEYVGYGRTFRTTRRSRIAVLPVGYADGYDRRLSNTGHVLVRGVRSPVRGRVCMNMTMIDVTDVSQVVEGDEVVLLGRQGDELISAEDLARLMGTINYEVVTRIPEQIPRVLV